MGLGCVWDRFGIGSGWVWDGCGMGWVWYERSGIRCGGVLGRVGPFEST